MFYCARRRRIFPAVVKARARYSFVQMTATAAALKRLEALFDDVKLADSGEPPRTKRGSVEKVHFAVTTDCDVHGGRRKSEHHLHHHRGSVVSSAAAAVAAVPRRDSVPASIPAASMRRRDSIVLGSPGRETLCHHPSSFPSSLRRDSLASSTSSLRRDSVGSTRRDSLSSPPPPPSSSTGVVLRRESPGAGRKDSSAAPAWRRFSTDSLDSVRRNSWDPSGRRGSSGSSAGCEDPIWEETRVSSARQLDVTRTSITTLLYRRPLLVPLRNHKKNTMAYRLLRTRLLNTRCVVPGPRDYICFV